MGSPSLHTWSLLFQGWCLLKPSWGPQVQLSAPGPGAASAGLAKQHVQPLALTSGALAPDHGTVVEPVHSGPFQHLFSSTTSVCSCLGTLQF